MQSCRVARGRDAGDIVVGWLVKLVVVLSVAGVLVFDGVSFGVAELAVTDTAVKAARAASDDLMAGRTPQQAFVTATDVAVTDHGFNEVPAEDFAVTRTGDVTVTVVRTTPTLVLHWIPRSERWLVADATATRTAG